MDRADVVMLKRRGRLGLMHKTLFRILVAGQLRRQELEGDGAFEFGVLGFVDDTHAAFPELFEDLVVGYGLADHPLIIAVRLEFVKTEWYQCKWMPN